jgi:SAM-dependent methyltransferase
MSDWTNQAYLLSEQYHNASNLSARMQLHERFSVSAERWHRWVFDRLTPGPDARVLEIGCGPGMLWKENVERIPAGWDVTLSDFSPGMLDDARRNLHASEHPFRFEVVDAQAIPFADASFDIVVANHMLYHVPDRPRAFAEIRRILRPDGRFYAATNSLDHMRELRDLAREFDPAIPFMSDQMAQSFNLEAGAAQLGPWFDPVTLHRYPSALVVTEAEPLVAYVLSGKAKSMLDGPKAAAFAAFVEQKIRENGAIRITKDSGLFEATPRAI